MNEENNGGRKDCTCCHMAGPMKMEFKTAMLDKKEKILKAKLEFIGKMREIVGKMAESK